MVFNTPAAGLAVINRLRRVARAIYFDLWPVRVGTAPPQSLQSCFRVAVAIHCRFTVYFYSRVQRHASPSAHPPRVPRSGEGDCSALISIASHSWRKRPRHAQSLRGRRGNVCRQKLLPENSALPPCLRAANLDAEGLRTVRNQSIL